MKILSAEQLREADAFTIDRENLAPGELMERAALSFTNWFEQHCTREKEIAIFCGPGNNGGDGLAIARLLNERDYLVRTFLPKTNSVFTPEFELNRDRLPQAIPVVNYQNPTELHHFHLGKTLIIDALFGTGLNRPLAGIYAETIEFLNALETEIISVDMPSGLYTNQPTPANAAVIQATKMVTFASPKLAFLLPQNQRFTGEMHTVYIGLSISFIASLHSPYHFTEADSVRSLWKPRPVFGHKGTFGHALLLAGSYGKAGAAVLTVRACLRSGAGLVSVSLPKAAYQIMQISAPEAMVIADASETNLTQLPAELEKYSAIGIGPGIGQAPETKKLLAELLEKTPAPLVLDADALNILSADKALLDLLPPETILTPHPKEFERITRPVSDDFERLDLLREFCEQYRCYVVLKGAYSCVGTPSGNLYFNSTGNAGMATGGSGDALTGIITALRAQRYSAEDACILGVYIHGLAGDFVKERRGETALIASDIIENLGLAFRTLEGK